jgi:hypothetical protein
MVIVSNSFLFKYVQTNFFTIRASPAFKIPIEIWFDHCNFESNKTPRTLILHLYLIIESPNQTLIGALSYL